MAQVAVGHLPCRLLPCYLCLESRPVHCTETAALLGVGEVVSGIFPHVCQGMAQHRAYDAVHGGVPLTAEIIGIGRVSAGIGIVLHRNRRGGGLEIGEQKGMLRHQLLQGVLIVVIPAGGVDVEGHGNIGGPLKTDGTQQGIAVCRGGGNVHKAVSFKSKCRRSGRSHAG